MDTPERAEHIAYFDRVYDETYEDMLRYTLVKARRAEDVEDLLQCTYARFYERICRRGHTDIESARAYLVTLLHRELARYYRFYANRREAALREDIERWYGAENYTHIMIRHAEVDSATDAFYAALEPILTHDADAAESAIECLKAHLQSIGSMEHVSFRSVF